MEQKSKREREREREGEGGTMKAITQSRRTEGSILAAHTQATALVC